MEYLQYTVKKVTYFPVFSRDVTYQTLPGREIIPGQGEFGKSGDGKTANVFLQCMLQLGWWPSLSITHLLFCLSGAIVEGIYGGHQSVWKTMEDFHP